MIQYHNWDITIILALDDNLPCYNKINFVYGYMLDNMHDFLLLQVNIMCFCLLLNALMYKRLKN